MGKNQKTGIWEYFCISGLPWLVFIFMVLIQAAE